MPASLHALASVSSIGREASLTSVSPEQNSSKPSPVPGPSTLIVTSGLLPWNASATSEEIGSTVDEPEITMSPDMVFELAPPPPEDVVLPSLEHAPATSA